MDRYMESENYYINMPGGIIAECPAEIILDKLPKLLKHGRYWVVRWEGRSITVIEDPTHHEFPRFLG